MTIGLPVSSIVAVSVSLTPTPTPTVDLNTLLVVVNESGINFNMARRFAQYSSLAEVVAAGFSTTGVFYRAAALYFGQTPRPQKIYAGRWAAAPTAGHVVGKSLTAAEQVIGLWTPITNGGFHVAIDGGASTNVTGINLSGATNLNGVAALITTALQAIGGAFATATINWNGFYFQMNSGSTGSSSSVSILTPPTAGTDLGPQLKLTTSTFDYFNPGVATETLVSAVTYLDSQVSTPWYEMMAYSSLGSPSNSDLLAVAAYIEGASNYHLFGITTADAAALVSPDTTSIGALLKALGYNRTLVQYSSTETLAVASLFGRMNTVNFAGNNTTITLMFKQEPGVVAETLTTSQAAALNAGNYNYFANYNNNTSIIVNGQVVSGQFIDTIWGLDGLASQIQVNCYNILYSTPKVPQTDGGMNMLAGGIAAACSQYNVNGFLATGVWTAAGFGQLQTGQTVPNGYYIYQPPISSQSVSDRALRRSVPFQVAAKLAGATHSVNVLLDVNP